MTPESGRTGRGRIGARWALAVLLVALSSVATLSDAQEPDKTGPSGRGRARPTDVVKASVDRVLAVVQASPMPASEGRRRSDIRQLADGLFDFTEMGRLTLAGHWKERTPREQQEFVSLFTALLERSYLSSIENYAGEKITFLNESVSGPYAQVRSRITTDRRVEISIDYRLIDNGIRWVVYDVALDGVSLVSNYRSQFNSIIRTSSFADLLTKLRNKEIAAHVVPRIGRGGS
ncbi:MAG TPA: ABC transporter substrate-binding protein [Candidatus Dormibacteraeota bacterium]|nr:ABC transporter substrate-binding protein [Candidatus Dormibacteraeota bacterium]